MPWCREVRWIVSWQPSRSCQSASATAYRLADMRYRGGVDSYLTAPRRPALALLRSTRVDGRAALTLANLVTLYKALGGGMLERTSTAQMAPQPGPLPGFARFELSHQAYFRIGRRWDWYGRNRRSSDPTPTSATHSWVGELLLRVLGAVASGGGDLGGGYMRSRRMTRGLLPRVRDRTRTERSDCGESTRSTWRNHIIGRRAACGVSTGALLGQLARRMLLRASSSAVFCWS